MKYILDTHAFLWAALDPRKLSKAAAEILKDSNSELFLSIASLWEIGILQSLERIELKVSIVEIAELAESELAATVLPINAADIDIVRTLPFHHRDPFDRLLIAQTVGIQAGIVGKDEVFDDYEVVRVW